MKVSRVRDTQNYQTPPVEIKISRVWAMPNRQTFSVKPIGEFVRRWLEGSQITVDPFSGGGGWANYTNDLNPDLHAAYHLDAREFLIALREQGVLCDALLFDPPYSPRQLAECYRNIGRTVGMKDTQSRTWSTWRDEAARLIRPRGIALSFGWNTVGFGKNRGFAIEEILLVCHGGMHNDTICLAERRVSEPPPRKAKRVPAST